MRVCIAIATTILSTSTIGWSADKEAAPAPKITKAGIRLSKETTFFTEPLREDGTINYVAALNKKFSQDVTPENNAAVLLWQAYGLPDGLGERFHERIVERLGLESLPLSSDEGTFVELSKIISDLKEKDPQGTDSQKILDQHDSAMKRPWSPEQFPAINQWIEANEKPLKLVTAATKKKHYFNPLASNDERETCINCLLPTIQFSREAARLLCARAMRSLEQNDAASAMQDLLTTHRLARLVGQGSSLIEALVGIAIDSMACEASHVVIATPGIVIDQLDSYQKQLASLPSLPSMAEKIELGERCFGLDAVQLIAVDRSQGLELFGKSAEEGVVGNIIEFLMENGVDWNLVLTRFNKLYDRLGTMMRIENRVTRDAAMEAFYEEMKQQKIKLQNLSPLQMLLGQGIRASVTEGMSVMLEGLLVPALMQANHAEERQTMKMEITRIGVAIASYRVTNNEYPQTLEDLQPKFLKEIPQDTFTGKPLVYKRTDKGFQLYSLGKNQTDDNGKFEYASKAEADDIGMIVPIPEDDSKD